MSSGRRSSAASTSSSARRDGRPSASHSCGRSWTQQAPAAVFIPNFSLGSVLGSALAAAAAPFFPSIEIVEAHRETKVDSPSGTAVRTAELIAAARAEVGPVESPHVDQRARGQQVASVPIHSLRRPGVIARQEVVLSGPGESLTLIHDTIEPVARLRPRHPGRARGGARRPRCRRRARQLPRHRHPRAASGAGAAGRRGRRARAGRTRHRRMSARIGVAVMAVLLALYIVLVAQRGVAAADQRRADRRSRWASASSSCPFIAAWALGRELWFGVRAEQLARRLESEGGLPAPIRSRVRPSGRVLREDADAVFPAYRADVEAHPEDWRAWYRLGLAYDAAGDRRRARAAVRQAIRLETAERRALVLRRAGTARIRGLLHGRVGEGEARRPQHRRNDRRVGRQECFGRIRPRHELQCPDRRAHAGTAGSCARRGRSRGRWRSRASVRPGSPGPATSRVDDVTDAAHLVLERDPRPLLGATPDGSARRRTSSAASAA